MKIFILVNHSWPHTGGCEKVVQQIAESLYNQFNCECHILSKSYSGSPMHHNNVLYKSLSPSPQKFLREILQEKPDHILVYSDMFVHWPYLLNNVSSIKCGKTIALVGMNAMRQDGRLLQKLIKSKDDINVVVHSKKYIDYLMCKHYKIPVSVIPNGVDLPEFQNCNIDFRDKYNIDKNKKIILCVSNFFPGKGQQYLPAIIKKVQKRVKDSILISICSDVDFPLAYNLQNNFLIEAKKENIGFRLLKNLDRETVVSAFLAADVFAFPSQKEVAPLVLIESMAAHTPWVSLPVGNSTELAGGIIVPNKNLDMDNNFVYNDEISDIFSKALIKVLENKGYRDKLTSEGKIQVQSDFCFDMIVNKYYDLIKKDKYNE